MSSKKQAENKAKKTSTSLSQLSYEEYCATLKLAIKIRIEQAKEIEKATTAKEKTKLLEKIFAEYNIPAHSSSLPKEREQAVLLKVNIFIPDNDQFLFDYKNKYDKNIRLISEGYQIPAPFAISKVAELSRYESYQARLKQEGGIKASKIEAFIPSMENIPQDTITLDDATPKSSSIKMKLGNHSKEEPSVPPIAFSPSAVTEELTRHMKSMEDYCVRLLASNNELGIERDSLIDKIRELETFIQNLQNENFTLGGEIIELKDKIKSSTPESSLRQQIKDLEFTNSELLAALQEQTKKTQTYRTRAIVAEAQLDQIRDGANKLVEEVDAIEIGDYMKGMSPHIIPLHPSSTDLEKGKRKS